MKKAFTLLEVFVLFFIFILIAFIVIPISIDDTNQVKHISNWKSTNTHLLNLFSTLNINNYDTKQFEQQIVESFNEPFEAKIKPYKILYLNGDKPDNNFIFENLYKTKSNKVLGFKWFKGKNDTLYGLVMYDINGKKRPNVWGKDVFGFSIDKNQIEPLCQKESLEILRSDCSKYGRGICCSYYYIIGGDF